MPMIEVKLTTNIHAETIAVFYDHEAYEKCRSIFAKIARETRMELVESYMSKWRIIKNNLGNSKTEYQVSDGDIGERTVSYDFDNIIDAEECLYNIEKGE